jgi:hypothetical protein
MHRPEILLAQPFNSILPLAVQEFIRVIRVIRGKIRHKNLKSMNRGAYKIRLCTMSDVPAVEELIPISVRGLQNRHYSQEQMDGALGTVFGVDTQLIRDGTYFVAEAESCVVGCGGWSKRKTLFGSDSAKTGEDLILDPSKDAARIRAFFTHPSWSRCGIATEILKRSETAAFTAGFHRIEIVATLTGEAFYQRFGYLVFERCDVPLPNGYQLPVVKMIKT